MENAVNIVSQHALDLVLAILLGVLIRYVGPLVRSKTDEADRVVLKDVVKDAVTAAEKRFIGEKLGLAVRKPWVKRLLEGLGYVVDDLIDVMIDRAAHELEEATKQAEAAAQKAVSDATQGRVTADTATAVIDALTQALGPTLAQEAEEEEATV